MQIELLLHRGNIHYRRTEVRPLYIDLAKAT